MENRIHTILGSLLLLGIVACIFSLSIAGDVKTFEVKADDYKFIPDTITVNQGGRVIIRGISIDKDHGFGIKAYNI
jgi:ABC-type transporter Mla subunit MlaD